MMTTKRTSAKEMGGLEEILDLLNKELECNSDMINTVKGVQDQATAVSRQREKHHNF